MRESMCGAIYGVEKFRKEFVQCRKFLITKGV